MSQYKIKELPETERPRERLKQVGVENLTNKELLSIILKTGLKNKNVSEISLEVLKKYQLKDLKDISLEELKQIKGIGEVKAIEVIASIELGKRILLKKEESIKLDNPTSIWKDALYYLSGKKQEYFYGYYFNPKQELIERKCLFIGTVNSSITHTREVFKEAYKVSASSIICIHNHPSNDVTPSKEDIQFTNALIETGKIQGIPVLDHMIIGENQYYSFYEENHFKN